MQFSSATLITLLSTALTLSQAAPVSLDSRADTSTKIVGVTHCKAFKSGHLNLVNPKGVSSPLTVADDSLLKYTSSSSDGHGHGHTKQTTVSFYDCDSSFMQFKDTKDKKYGILKVFPDGEGERCVTSYSAPKATPGTSVFLTQDKCTYSDDSGQIQQYFEYDVSTGNVIFLGRRQSDYFAGSAYRYAFTPHNQVLGLEEGSDLSHFTLK